MRTKDQSGNPEVEGDEVRVLSFPEASIPHYSMLVLVCSLLNLYVHAMM